MADHAQHSPSQLHRIISCPGSVKLCESEPNETSSYADEGTMLHSVMEKSFTLMCHPLILPNDALVCLKLPALTREQRRACEGAAEYFYSVLQEAQLEGPVQIELETKTSLAYLGMPTCYGTADVKLTTPKTLHILDWKFGQGVEVMVKDNPQLLAYALGSASSIEELLSYEKIVTHVAQPRLDNFYGQEYTPQELLLWCEETLRPALILAETNGPCNPGVDQCRWCLAKLNCTARFDLAKSTAERVFAMYAQPGIVTDEDRADLLKDAPVLESYFKELRIYAFTQCVNGTGFPGYKVVCGRTSRGWTDEEAAREFLLAKCDEPDAEFSFEDLFESKFVSPPKAEKLTKTLKKDKEFLALITKYPGKPTLVKETDPREPYSMDATSGFAQFVEEN